MGVDPHPFTLRELCAMHDARAESDWNHTASVMALLANINRDPKRSKPLKIDDFHPMRARPTKIHGDITMLKAAFLRGEA